MKFVPKRWGWEEIYVNNELYCFKKLYIYNGKSTSLHRHFKKDETFVLEKGKAEIELQNAKGQKEVKELNLNERSKTLRIPSGLIHRITSLVTVAVIIEVSTHHDDNDIERLEI